MERVAKILLVLVICVVAMAHQTAAEESKGKDLINKVCSRSSTTDMCNEVLSSDSISPNANLKDLAIIALRVAANNASSILNDVKTMIDDAELDPDIQQGLADCKETILDAESQLEDTIAALLVDADVDAQLWLKAALAAIQTCDDSIPGKDDVLSVKSATFRKLCNIAVALSLSLPNQN
ncbi:uncharacterized protein LOC133308837 [Gastrolobium bilobum]|uniref:uncharacterized protein LOC133308837 n=1 Tax=Gastrolobium bilobum TaxID=150636 RepID=UPI002AAF37BA|nr:uncharacterized protein LOC133308837 [Gastrolobium bilobum]